MRWERKCLEDGRLAPRKRAGGKLGNGRTWPRKWAGLCLSRET